MNSTRMLHNTPLSTCRITQSSDEESVSPATLNHAHLSRSSDVTETAAHRHYTDIIQRPLHQYFQSPSPYTHMQQQSSKLPFV